MTREELGAYLGLAPERTAALAPDFVARFTNLPAPHNPPDAETIAIFQGFLEAVGQAPKIFDVSFNIYLPKSEGLVERIVKELGRKTERERKLLLATRNGLVGVHFQSEIATAVYLSGARCDVSTTTGTISHENGARLYIASLERIIAGALRGRIFDMAFVTHDTHRAEVELMRRHSVALGSQMAVVYEYGFEEQH